jgi:hypothetical protein
VGSGFKSLAAHPYWRKGGPVMRLLNNTITANERAAVSDADLAEGAAWPPTL